jgi:plasmid stabilization system protein ParE
MPKRTKKAEKLLKSIHKQKRDEATREFHAAMRAVNKELAEVKAGTRKRIEPAKVKRRRSRSSSRDTFPLR